MRSLLKIAVALAVIGTAGVTVAQVKPIPDRKITPPSETPGPRGPLGVPTRPGEKLKPIEMPPVAPAPPGVLSVTPEIAGRIDVEQSNISSLPSTLSVVFVRLPAGANVRAITSNGLPSEMRTEFNVQRGSTRCFGRAFGQVANGSPRPESVGVIGADGRVRLTVSTSLRVPAGSTGAAISGPCSVIIPLEVKRTASSPSEFYIVKTPSFTPKLRKTYRYTDTWALRRFFNFAMTSMSFGSTCEGTSVGPFESYPVGVRERNGDLTVQIRSGPVGTGCRVSSPGLIVPYELELLSIEWAVERVGDKCCAGEQCGATGRSVPGQLPGNAPGLYIAAAPARTNAAGEYPTVTPFDRIIGRAHIELKCSPAGQNDHGVRLVLKSATFEGSPDYAMP